MLFGITTTILAFALLEGGSRLVEIVKYPPDPLIADGNATWGHSRDYDPLLFWRLRPGATIQGDVANSLGLRGPEIPPKSSTELRVLSLGDSTTYGWKIPYEQAYTARLEARARQTGDVRCINAGLPGYTVFQGRVFLEYHGLELAPDTVLLYFGFNDFQSVAFRERRDAMAGRRSTGLTDRELFSHRRSLPVRLADWGYRHSNVFRWIGLHAHPVLQSTDDSRPNEGALQVATDPNLTRVPDEDRWVTLGEILRICKAHDIDLVIIVPWYREFEAHAPLLRRFAAEFDVPLVDLPVLLAHLSGERSDYFLDECHPNAEGHRVIADAVWDTVGTRLVRVP